MGGPSAHRKEARLCTKAFRPFEEAEKAPACHNALKHSKYNF